MPDSFPQNDAGPPDAEKTHAVPAPAPTPGELVHANAGRLLAGMLGSAPGCGEQEGDVIGPYRLCELLGEGGFGNVWHAEQTHVVKREVALKLIKPGMDSAQVLGRFNQERQALASLRHPNIATLLDAGVGPNGRPYFAMELVHGGPVTDWCRAADATLEERLRLFIQICQAVQHAHEKGILHRDIKPTNILVTEIDGQPVPKVIDFGIAKAISASSIEELSLLTQAGQVIGTPMYMSPEQIQGGRELDARSDVYALGVVLYELLTGLPPFDMSGAAKKGIDSIKEMILEVTPERPSTRLRQKTATRSGDAARPPLRTGTLSADLDWITLRALEKDRRRRYADARELAADLQRHLDSERVEARPPSLAYTASRWVKRHRTACLSAAAAVLVAVTAVQATRYIEKANAPPKTPREIALEEMKDGYTNSLGMKFIIVPGTEVLMCIHETRRQDYAAYAAEVKGVNPLWRTILKNPPPADQEGVHPVCGVNWLEATAFCNWLSKKEGKAYRVPTDREWSVAVGIAEEEDRVTRGTFGIGGTALNDLRLKAKEPGNYASGDPFPSTAPVMSFPPNPLGFYDTGGNVGEWVLEWSSAEKSSRNVRGGGWGAAEGGDLSRRSPNMPDFHSDGLGFRLVLLPGATPETVLPEALEPIAEAGRVPAPLRFPELSPKDTFTNSLGMKFIPIIGGQVFYCVHETRRRDFATYIADNPGTCKLWNDPRVFESNPEKRDDVPITFVSWSDAKNFCRWLSKREGKFYGLPTDAEWSTAAGMGLGAPAPLEEDLLSGRFDNYADISLHHAEPDLPHLPGYDDGFAGLAPVMSFPPNSQGLHDIGGNVSEWLEEYVHTASVSRRFRGSNWSANTATVTLRSPAGINTHAAAVGFRIVQIPTDRLETLRPNWLEGSHYEFKNPNPNSKAPTVTLGPALPKDAVVNSLGMAFLPVPGTHVLFCIHETRRQDYIAYCRENPNVPSTWDGRYVEGISVTPVLVSPVAGVSWDAVQGFCAWLSKKEGKTYRLPTDREWSLAVGLGDFEKPASGDTPRSLSLREKTQFPWGAIFPPQTSDRAGNYADLKFHSALFHGEWLATLNDGVAAYGQVMDFKTNRFGLYDLGGNVWEWCQD